MIRQEENWKAFIVANQAHYNKTNESKFNLIELTPEERGWTELFQVYPPITPLGGSGTSPVNGRSYSWTYGFLPVGYFGVKNQSRVFTSSGTWTCPDGVNEIYVKCVGKGANGNTSSGGGGGGFIMAKISVVPGTSYAITIDSAASSFGGVMSALAAIGSLGGSFTSTENIEVLFKGQGGDADLGGGGGGSELGKGGKGGSGGGGGGLHSENKSNISMGGCGMLSVSPDGGGAGGSGFMSKKSRYNDNGRGMFSTDVGIKFSGSPNYNKLSVDITEDLGTWGTPGNYGGGSYSAIGEVAFSGGMSSGFNGGFGGGGGLNIKTDDINIVVGGKGGYGGGGGFGKNRGSYYGYGGDGGSGGGGGQGIGTNTGASRGGNGGYGGGGGASGNSNYGKGGNGLVIIEW